MQIWSAPLAKSVCAFCVATFLLGCSGSTSAPAVPSSQLQFSIADSSGNSLRSLKINPAQLSCVYAHASEPFDTAQLTFAWKSQTDSSKNTLSFCPSIPVGANGTDYILLEITDREGNKTYDTLPYLVNTPPTFAIDSSYYKPKQGSVQYPDSSLGIVFSWSASDPDYGDSLHYLLRLGIDNSWTDSLTTTNATGIRWPIPLATLTQYQWQVVAIDRWGGRDSTQVRTFSTRAGWDLPRTVHGFVSSTTRWSDYKAIRVIAIAPNADTLSFPLDSLWGYTVHPGPSIAQLRLCAKSPDGVSTDTLTVQLSDTSSTSVSIRLTL